MNLNDYFNTQESQASFSRRTRIPQSSLSFWKNGERPIPIPQMPVIEKETNGLVTRKDMYADWETLWPELADNQSSANA